LLQLARAYGIQTSYNDIEGVRRSSSPEAMLLTLRALGAPVESFADVREALQRRDQHAARPGIEPVHVAWDGQLDGLAGNLPAGKISCRFSLETGAALEWRGTPKSTRDWQGNVRSRVALRGPLPLGYHRLEVRAGNQSFESLIIASPRLAHVPERARSWGLFLPLYALLSERSPGVGDYSDLERMARWTGELGGSFFGTLPLLATFLGSPFEPSPYAPVSRLFWSDLFIDVERLPGAAQLPVDIEQEFACLREGDFVDYARSAALQRRLTADAAERFFQAGGESDPAFKAFLQRHPAARDYARFRATVDRREEGWGSWPERMRLGELRPGDFDEAEERYHLFASWAAEDQLTRVAAGSVDGSAALYLDLPLGVHGLGYDTWRMHDLFAHEVSAGSPPDDFFRSGQTWGFPPLHPAAIRADGYRYFIDCLRNHLHLAGALRLDHVMALQRLFWIPRGLDATHGVYVRYPMAEMFAILTLESVRHQAVIIGEDLGTVSREIRSAMKRHRIQRMWVYQFQPLPARGNQLPEIPRSVIASLNTHDLQPFAAYWDALDVAQRRARGTLFRAGRTPGAAAVVEALLEYIAASPARILLVNLEDLWLETRPQNVPGTTTEQPNWRRRARYMLEQIQNHPDVLRTLSTIAERRDPTNDHG
jgi:4-alpha-glucanotransferase